MIYWDTSCVLKLYAPENDSGQWASYALDADDEFASSTLLETEMVCALWQKELRGEIVAGAASKLCALFRSDISSGRFTLYPVGSDVRELAEELAAACYAAADPVPLRTLDVLHLATARLIKSRVLATTDRRMRAAAAVCGIALA